MPMAVTSSINCNNLLWQALLENNKHIVQATDGMEIFIFVSFSTR